MKEMKSVPLNKELYNYILDTFVEKDPLLDELIVETEKAEIPLIQVAPEQGSLCISSAEWHVLKMLWRLAH